MRPLALDIILLLAPLLCGVAAFAIGTRAVRWPVRARVAVIAAPTVVMCMVTLLLLGAA